MSHRKWHLARKLVGVYFTGIGDTTTLYTISYSDQYKDNRVPPENRLKLVQHKVNEKDLDPIYCNKDYQVLCTVKTKEEFPEVYL